ncbi:MAG: 50S ribosomal protein L21 [Bacteroidetes bacterium]|nr:50S ribosomal protein L21 [Bacteroidota bacterium]
MYAVVEIAGTQVKVSPSDKVFVPKIQSEIGSKIKFDKVLLTGDEKKAKVGSPYVKGAVVEAKVLRHLKDDTVIVLKKKKRKGYRVRNGHRQQYTEIEITNLA